MNLSIRNANLPENMKSPFSSDVKQLEKDLEPLYSSYSFEKLQNTLDKLKSQPPSPVIDAHINVINKFINEKHPVEKVISHIEGKDKETLAKEKFAKENPEIQKLLYRGAVLGDLEMIKSALDQGAYINGDDDFAIAVAAAQGKFNAVLFLYRNGAYPSDKAIKNASEGGFPHIVKFLFNVALKTDKPIKVDKKETNEYEDLTVEGMKKFLIEKFGRDELYKMANYFTMQECYEKAEQYKAEDPEQYAKDINKINLGMSGLLPNGWTVLGKPSDGHYHNPELKWHAFTVGTPSNKFIVVVDQNGQHVGEIDSPEELP